MKKIFTFIVCAVALPAGAFNHAALERAVLSAPDNTTPLQVYSTNHAENARQAVRLGYNNFHARVNTPFMTHSDVKIAVFITYNLKPFFDKINNLPATQAPSDFHEEFVALLAQLSGLFQKNQPRYTNPLLIDSHAAVQETLLIVQEALNRGSF